MSRLLSASPSRGEWQPDRGRTRAAISPVQLSFGTSGGRAGGTSPGRCGTSGGVSGGTSPGGLGNSSGGPGGVSFGGVTGSSGGTGPGVTGSAGSPPMPSVSPFRAGDSDSIAITGFSLCQFRHKFAPSAWCHALITVNHSAPGSLPDRPRAIPHQGGQKARGSVAEQGRRARPGLAVEPRALHQAPSSPEMVERGAFKPVFQSSTA